MKSDDIEVIKAVLDGDKNQYRSLVDRYKNGLTTYLYNYTHNSSLAEEIAQDSFVTAYQKLAQYDTQYSFSTWLYAIASNTAKKHYRTYHHDLPLESSAISVDPTTPEEISDQNERANITRRAIQKLKPEYQEVLNLFYWEDKTYNDIAYIMNQPVNTIRTWISRSKKDLEATLNGLI